MTRTRFHRSRRFRYSLRALLVLTAVVAVALAWVHRARQQQVAVALLQKSNPGVRLFYNMPCGAPGATGPRSDSLASRWARTLLGIDYGATVVSVNLSYPTDADMECLARLPHLQVVTLDRAVDLTDKGLAQLLALDELRVLSIRNGEQLTDAGLRRLAALESLEILRIDLGRFHVSQETLELLRRALPQCKIDVGAKREATPDLATLALGQ